MSIPYTDQAECVRREIKLREWVYPKWVHKGKMTQKLADQELARMKAVLETIEKHIAKQEVLL